MNILEIEEAIIELKDLSLNGQEDLIQKSNQMLKTSGTPSRYNLRRCLTKNSTKPPAPIEKDECWVSCDPKMQISVDDALKEVLDMIADMDELDELDELDEFDNNFGGQVYYTPLRLPDCETTVCTPNIDMPRSPTVPVKRKSLKGTPQTNKKPHEKQTRLNVPARQLNFFN